MFETDVGSAFELFIAFDLVTRVWFHHSLGTHSFVCLISSIKQVHFAFLCNHTMSEVPESEARARFVEKLQVITLLAKKKAEIEKRIAQEMEKLVEPTVLLQDALSQFLLKRLNCVAHLHEVNNDKGLQEVMQKQLPQPVMAVDEAWLAQHKDKFVLYVDHQLEETYVAIELALRRRLIVLGLGDQRRHLVGLGEQTASAEQTPQAPQPLAPLNELFVGLSLEDQRRWLRDSGVSTPPVELGAAPFTPRRLSADRADRSRSPSGRPIDQRPGCQD